MARIDTITERLQRLFSQLSYRQLLVAAAVCSLLLGAAVFFLLSGDDGEKQQAAAPQRVRVVVAKQDIPQRAVVKETMLDMKEVPTDVLPAGAITDMASVVDRPASVPIQQGDILTDKKVLVDPRMAGFTGMIPDNCRAMSISISDVTGVAGFARPGDYVDVMVVSKGKEKVSGEILLQNILLLGINKTGGDGSAPASAKAADKGSGAEDKAKAAKDKAADDNASQVKASSDAMATATLAVTPEDALKLAVAAQNGTIYLILRPFHPRDIFTVNTDFFQLLDSGTAAPAQQPAAPASPAAAPAAPARQTTVPTYQPPAAAAPAASKPQLGGIEVYRGTQSSIEGGF